MIDDITNDTGNSLGNSLQLCSLFFPSLHPQNKKMTHQIEKTARAMTNVLNLFVSLRRKTDGSPHLVVQTYWIKKDDSSLFGLEKQPTIKCAEKQTDVVRVTRTGCVFCLGIGLLAVPSRQTRSQQFVLSKSN